MSPSAPRRRPIGRRSPSAWLVAPLLAAAACGGGGTGGALSTEVVEDGEALPFFAEPEADGTETDADGGEDDFMSIAADPAPADAFGGVEVVQGGEAPIEGEAGDTNGGTPEPEQGANVGEGGGADDGGGDDGGGSGGSGASGGVTRSGAGTRVTSRGGSAPSGRTSTTAPFDITGGDVPEGFDDDRSITSTTTSRSEGTSTTMRGSTSTTAPSLRTSTTTPSFRSTTTQGSGGSDVVDDPVFSPDRPDPTPVAVVDDFSDADQWLLYEQLIPGRPDCYGLDLATATLYTLDDGDRVLALTANAVGSSLSNHALLGRLISDRPVSFGPHSFTLTAMIDPDTADGIQTGPEFSAQITAEMADGRFLTAVFGVQYVPATEVWQVLVNDGDEAGWFEVRQAGLEPGQWYDITFRFDTGTDRYVELVVDGPGGFEVDLSTLRTVWQDKNLGTEATWATVDVENLFTCDDPRVVRGTVYYDDLSLVTE